MTFTYTPSTPTDTTRIRYHIGDTVEDEAIFSDEEIAFVLSEKSTVGATVVSLLEARLAKLSTQTDFQADWLRVQHETQLKALNNLIDRKSAEFNISRVNVSSVRTERYDSPEHYDATDREYNYFLYYDDQN